MDCAFRQICRILLEQVTKESSEYIEGVWLAEEEKPSAGNGGRYSESNIWGEVRETIISYIFVGYFYLLYERVGCDHSSLLSLPLQPPRGVPAATCQGSQAAARCSSPSYGWCGGQRAFKFLSGAFQ